MKKTWKLVDPIQTGPHYHRGRHTLPERKRRKNDFQGNRKTIFHVSSADRLLVRQRNSPSSPASSKSRLHVSDKSPTRQGPAIRELLDQMNHIDHNGCYDPMLFCPGGER